MEIEFRCADCRSVNQQEDLAVPVKCNSCGKAYGNLSDFSDGDSRLQFCVICRCRDLYIQKDFNRKLGLAIAGIGAVLAPFTKLISLLVCALIDLVLYLTLPVITVCYRCHSIYRSFAKNPAHEGFNLGINDRYRSLERSP
jgi:hypothetical protein